MPANGRIEVNLTFNIMDISLSKVAMTLFNYFDGSLITDDYFKIVSSLISGSDANELGDAQSRLRLAMFRCYVCRAFFLDFNNRRVNKMYLDWLHMYMYIKYLVVR